MTQGKITASAAMLNVLKTWGVDTIYGIPSGTLSSLMDALAEDKELITNATQLLSELNKSFQSCKQGTADDIRLQELLNTTLQELKKAEKLNNSILIDLEKFYQRTSLLIGLGSLKLNDQARTAWRNYDKFHYDHIKHVLTLYGPVFGF